jgi:hypothetical protein
VDLKEILNTPKLAKKATQFMFLTRLLGQPAMNGFENTSLLLRSSWKYNTLQLQTALWIQSLLWNSNRDWARTTAIWNYSARVGLCFSDRSRAERRVTGSEMPFANGGSRYRKQKSSLFLSLCPVSAVA